MAMTTPTREYTEAATATAQTYYNSSDADSFYSTIWGGEDIHIGLYDSPGEEIGDASRRTVQRMIELVKPTPAERILDVGAGYGGAARALASGRGCSVVALNLSEVENERDRRKNRENGLDDKIEVVDASFENIPFENGTFDIVWSQDAMLHSGNRARVLAEVARVLKPDGRFIFTDPMRTDDCPEGVLDPILDRLHLDDLASPAFYRETLAKLGFREVVFEEMAHQLATHYQRVHDETVRRDEELAHVACRDYIERMKIGLRHWVKGGRNGYLTWGIFHFVRNG